MEKIEGMLDGISLERFKAETMRRLATERCLEIVCEAAHTLPDEIKKEAPDIDWRAINGFANLLRHAYHTTNVDIVWDVIQNHLPPLKAFVEVQIRTFDQ